MPRQEHNEVHNRIQAWCKTACGFRWTIVREKGSSSGVQNQRKGIGESFTVDCTAYVSRRQSRVRILDDVAHHPVLPSRCVILGKARTKCRLDARCFINVPSCLGKVDGIRTVDGRVECGQIFPRIPGALTLASMTLMRDSFLGFKTE